MDGCGEEEATRTGGRDAGAGRSAVAGRLRAATIGGAAGLRASFAGAGALCVRAATMRAIASGSEGLNGRSTARGVSGATSVAVGGASGGRRGFVRAWGPASRRRASIGPDGVSATTGRLVRGPAWGGAACRASVEAETEAGGAAGRADTGAGVAAGPDMAAGLGVTAGPGVTPGPGVAAGPGVAVGAEAGAREITAARA
jgi:hypothetical protein